MRRPGLGIAALLLAGAALAQGLGDGKWWKRPRIAQALELTPAQSAELERIFAKCRPRLIDLKADLEKRQFEYEQAMTAATVDRKLVETTIEAREEARARLQKELALMELDMKQVLTPAQREKAMQIREQIRQKMMDRRRSLREGELGADSPPPSRKPGQRPSPPPNE